MFSLEKHDILPGKFTGKLTYKNIKSYKITDKFISQKYFKIELHIKG